MSLTSLPEGGNPIVLPKASAQKLGLEIGDKVVLYFLGERVTVRACTLMATLELTNTVQPPVSYTQLDVYKRQVFTAPWLMRDY